MRVDPSDNGGLFIGRRPGTRPVRYRTLPAVGSQRRRTVDAALALGVLMAMVLVCLCFWGPLPAGWLWVGSQIDFRTDSVTLAIFCTFVGLIVSLLVGLMVLKRLDGAWILLRRAAGHDQRSGVIGTVFATTCVIGTTLFGIWFLLLGGLASSSSFGHY